MINISRTEIVVQILEIANTSSGDYDEDDVVIQTKIMHNTNLLHLCLTKRVFESSN
jgi:hypothetical protein